MRPESQVKLFINQEKKSIDQGFTLVELLVVIVIIGILAAVALPNFLSQSAKAKQSEAKQYVAIINRSQIAYRTDRNSFATSINELGIGALTNSQSSTLTYNYILAGGTDSSSISAASKDTAVKGYSGSVVRYNSGANSEAVISSVICESNVAALGAAGLIINATMPPACDIGSTDLKAKI